MDKQAKGDYKTLKLIGFALSIVSAIIGILCSSIADKKLDLQINDKVDKAVNAALKETKGDE